MHVARRCSPPGFHHLPLMLGILLLLCARATAGERYSLVSVSSPGDVRRIARLGIAVDHAAGRQKGTLELYLNSREKALLDNHAIPYTTLIEDWARHYRERRAAESASGSPLPVSSTVQGFHYGSMGGYLTFSEVLSDLDSMRARYPSLITARAPIGYSHEGRALWAVKISARADQDENEPRAFYNALIHAREPGAMMALLYTMWYLLEQYGKDPEVTAILDTRELYFLPVINPDGYVYNETMDPAGGGMWRKNRRNNGDGSYGVDLNRNFGFAWGYDDEGSSPEPYAETYRGPSGFSEPEIQAVRDFCAAKKFSAALNYHTYSNLLIYPWGFSDTDTPDSTMFRQLAEQLTSVNRYSYGTPGQTVGYITNGGVDDWMYGDTLLKPKAYSMTPELGNPIDGFWPLQSRIFPIAEENLQANITLAHAAGAYIRVSSSELDTAGGGYVLRLRFADRGVMPPPSTLQLRLSSGQLAIADSLIPAVEWNSPAPLAVAVVPRSSPVWPGELVTIVAAMEYEGGMTRDTLRERLGPPSEIYADDAESTRANWTAESNAPGTVWDTTSVLAHSGTRSFTESPGGFYADNMTSTFTLNRSLGLLGGAAELRFWLRWGIETNYDYLTVEISTDGGLQWEALSGRYTAQGSGVGVQALYGPGYDGVKHTWVEERMELPTHALGYVKLRFRFRSDEFVTLDGAYIDDLRVLLYPASPDAVPDRQGPLAYRLEQNYPNPFNPATEIRMRLASSGRVRLAVYDLLGREVVRLVDGWLDAGDHTVAFSAAGLASGVYIYRLQAGDFVSARMMILLQ